MAPIPTTCIVTGAGEFGPACTFESRPPYASRTVSPTFRPSWFATAKLGKSSSVAAGFTIRPARIFGLLTVNPSLPSSGRMGNTFPGALRPGIWR